MSTTLAAPSTISTPVSTSRIASIDLIRGAVMILMAIDHVRVYSGLPARWPYARNFLHPMEHPFLRAGLHLPRGNQRLFLCPQAHRRLRSEEHTSELQSH